MVISPRKNNCTFFVCGMLLSVLAPDSFGGDPPSSLPRKEDVLPAKVSKPAPPLAGALKKANKLVRDMAELNRERLDSEKLFEGIFRVDADLESTETLPDGSQRISALMVVDRDGLNFASLSGKQAIAEAERKVDAATTASKKELDGFDFKWVQELDKKGRLKFWADRAYPNKKHLDDHEYAMARSEIMERNQKLIDSAQGELNTLRLRSAQQEREARDKAKEVRLAVLVPASRLGKVTNGKKVQCNAKVSEYRVDRDPDELGGRRHISSMTLTVEPGIDGGSDSDE